MSEGQSYSKLGFVIVIFVFLALVNPVLGQTAKTPVFAYSQGVLQADNSVLYSVLVMSDVESVSGLTVKISVPKEAISAETVIAPESASLVAAESDEDTFVWQVDQLDAASVLGPFTIRVVLPETTLEIPASVPAVVTWTAPDAGSLDAVLREGLLEPPETSASMTLDARGTVDENGDPAILQVANTDIWIDVPEGALSETVTLVFTRLVIDAANSPEGMDNTWWCVLIMIESDSVVTFTKPITIVLPTRQILTPGMEVQVLTRTDSDEWQALDTVQGLGINRTGAYAGVMITGTAPEMLAVGVFVPQRKKATEPAPPPPCNVSGGGFNASANVGSANGGGFNSGFNASAGGGFNGSANTGSSTGCG